MLSGNHDGEQLFNTVPDSGFNMTVNGNSLPKNLKLFPGAGKAYRYGNVVITGLNSLKLPVKSAFKTGRYQYCHDARTD